MRHLDLLLFSLPAVAPAVLVVLAVVGLGPSAEAQIVSPPADPSTVTVESLGGITRTQGWCVKLPDDTTTLDAWELAPPGVPKRRVRFVTIAAIAEGTMCAQLGGALEDCDPESGAASGVLRQPGAAITWTLARAPREDPPPILLRGDVPAICIDVGW